MQENNLKSRQAQDIVHGWIKQGQLGSGDRLPSEPDLARRLKMNHQTVRRGLAVLQAKGLIEKRAGVGNFVAKRHPLAVNHRIGMVLPKQYLALAAHHPEIGITVSQVKSSLGCSSYSLTMLEYENQQFWYDVGESVIAHDIKGLLVYSNGLEVKHVQRLLDAGVKICLLNSDMQLDKLSLFSIKYDEDEALNQIVGKFVVLGHRRIAVVMDSGWRACTHDRYARQIQSLFTEYGLGSAKSMMVYPSWDPDVGERDCAVLGAILDVDAPPTAIIVPDETFAQGVFRFCYARNIDVPGAISIATLQNLTPHAHGIPVSSPDSVSLLKRGVDMAVKHLMQIMNGENPMEREICLRCDVNWTNSVGPVSRKKRLTSVV